MLLPGLLAKVLEKQMGTKHNLMQYSIFPLESLVEMSDGYCNVYAQLRDKVAEQTSPVKYTGIDELWDECSNENN
jgi:hypothetical protein